MPWGSARRASTAVWHIGRRRCDHSYVPTVGTGKLVQNVRLVDGSTPGEVDRRIAERGRVSLASQHVHTVKFGAHRRRERGDSRKRLDKRPGVNA